MQFVSSLMLVCCALGAHPAAYGFAQTAALFYALMWMGFFLKTHTPKGQQSPQ